MIQPDPTVFPNNIVEVLKTELQKIDTELSVVRRPLQTTDVEQAVGVFALDWIPDETSIEMRGGTSPAPQFPTLSEHYVSIQSLIRDTDEERGIATHSALAQRIRSTVARSASLRLALAALTWTGLGSTERAKRWGISRQRYMTTEVQGTWLYLSITEFKMETETT
jgi:hypothetical protein